jgi:transcriptional regulator with XRE-family HTH domain
MFIHEEVSMQKMLLGQRIREFREQTGMSQVALARALGASTNAINMLEAGSIRAPHIDRLIAIADLFGVSIDYLVGRTDAPKPRPSQEQSTEDAEPVSSLEKPRRLVRARVQHPAKFST